MAKGLQGLSVKPKVPESHLLILRVECTPPPPLDTSLWQKGLEVKVTSIPPPPHTILFVRLQKATRELLSSADVVLSTNTGASVEGPLV